MRPRHVLRAVLAFALTAPLLASAGPWTRLGDGVEHAHLVLPAPEDRADGGVELSPSAPAADEVSVHVVRVDPSRATLELALASELDGGRPRRCGEWADERGYAVTVNAGMYGTDERTNVGYLRHGGHTNNGRWSSSYQSALVFGPLAPGLPAAQLVDLDVPGAQEVAARYASAVQNLRLLKREGVSVWSPNGRAWSEAALGVDGAGRLLFMFVRRPLEMVELNRRLLALGLDLRRAMHLDGGPPACLSVRGGGLRMDLAGTFESPLFDRGVDARQLRVPNVLGVRLAVPRLAPPAAAPRGPAPPNLAPSGSAPRGAAPAGVRPPVVAPRGSAQAGSTRRALPVDAGR